MRHQPLLAPAVSRSTSTTCSFLVTPETNKKKGGANLTLPDADLGSAMLGCMASDLPGVTSSSASAGGKPRAVFQVVTKSCLLFSLDWRIDTEKYSWLQNLPAPLVSSCNPTVAPCQRATAPAAVTKREEMARPYLPFLQSRLNFPL